MDKKLTGVQERKYSITPMERAVGDNGKSMFKGKAVAFDSWSNLLYNDFKEIIAAGAMDGAKLDRALAVFNHKEDYLLGTYEAGTLRVIIRQDGVYVEIDEADTTISKDCAQWVSRGEIRGMSFKFTVVDNGSRWEYDRNTDTYLHYIDRIDEVFDFSLVTRAAYPDTNVSNEMARSYGFDAEGIKSQFVKGPDIIVDDRAEIERNYKQFLIDRSNNRRI